MWGLTCLITCFLGTLVTLFLGSVGEPDRQIRGEKRDPHREGARMSGDGSDMFWLRIHLVLTA